MFFQLMELLVSQANLQVDHMIWFWNSNLGELAWNEVSLLDGHRRTRFDLISQNSLDDGKRRHRSSEEMHCKGATVLVKE